VCALSRCNRIELRRTRVRARGKQRRRARPSITITIGNSAGGGAFGSNIGAKFSLAAALGRDSFSATFTYHPLGGAVMDQTTDADGRVKGAGRLYVTDSASLPGSCAGANPSFTIAALAERNIECIIDEDLD
jgi:choline dehydrogenase-like flavoprotein